MDQYIKPTRKAVYKIKVFNVFKLIKHQIVSIVSYLSSIITIITLKFTSSGQFSFDFNNFYDYLILFIIIVLSYVGFSSILNDVKMKKKSIVSRSQLHDLLTLARYNASHSIINFAGDLSWLLEDYDSILKIKKLHPNVSMTVFYNKEVTSKNALPLIRDLQEKNVISFIPYINPNSMKIKCMIIDMEIDANDRKSSKIYVYDKTENLVDKFYWEEFTPDDDHIYYTFESLLLTLKKLNKQRIKIGISGVNNVGKTTLLELCRKELKHRYQVKTYQDFYDKFNEKTLYHNLCLLLQQLIIESSCENEITIFDRTLLDNYFYMYIRHEELCLQYENASKQRKDTFKQLHLKDTELIEKLYPIVFEQLNSYDMIIYLRRNDEHIPKNTTHVSAVQRRKVYELYTKFYTNYSGKTPVVTYEVDTSRFDDSIKEIAVKAIQRIELLFNIKNNGFDLF